MRRISLQIPHLNAAQIRFYFRNVNSHRITSVRCFHQLPTSSRVLYYYPHSHFTSRLRPSLHPLYFLYQPVFTVQKKTELHEKTRYSGLSAIDNTPVNSGIRRGLRTPSAIKGHDFRQLGPSARKEEEAQR